MLGPAGFHSDAPDVVHDGAVPVPIPAAASGSFPLKTLLQHTSSVCCLVIYNCLHYTFVIVPEAY